MTRFDHALIFVRDLRRALRDYQALGFTVLAGGAHEGGPTENALVPFADGSYLELIAFRRWTTRALLGIVARLGLVERAAGAPLARRFALRAARGEGLIDLAVCVDGLAPLIETAARAGVTIHGPVPGSRSGADGVPIVWELGIPQDDEVPLLIGDVTPRDRRVAAPPDLRHANGVMGIAGAVAPVRDPAGAAARLRDLLGAPARAEAGEHTVTLGATELVFVPAPAPGSGRPARLLLTGPSSRRLDLRAAHGAVLDLG